MKKWAVIINPGLDTEQIESEFDRYDDANHRYHVLFDQGELVDVLKRDENGNLTTEY